MTDKNISPEEAQAVLKEQQKKAFECEKEIKEVLDKHGLSIRVDPQIVFIPKKAEDES